MCKHQTVKVKHNNIHVDIDTEIADLMTSIWADGMETVACCQGSPSPHDYDKFIAKYAYISFRNHNHIVQFINKYPIVRDIGEFDVIKSNNMKFGLKAQEMIDYALNPDNLYSVRFNHEFLEMLTI
jgi:hypothetical protein